MELFYLNLIPTQPPQAAYFHNDEFSVHIHISRIVILHNLNALAAIETLMYMWGSAALRACGRAVFN